VQRRPALHGTTLPRGPGVVALDEPAAEGSRRIRVWTYRPSGFVPGSPILVVLHGYMRNARTYRDDWAAHAERLGALLAVPEFDQRAFPGPRAYEVGNMRTADRRAFRDERLWAFAVVERVFEGVRALVSSTRTGYWLYGHSAGGQLVHRMALLAPEVRFEVAIAANAGAYTLPRRGERFPYGLDGAPVGETVLERAFARRLVVMLGGRDTDTGHRVLLRSAEAQRQGPHRFARGLTFFDEARHVAEAAGLPFDWRLVRVPDAGHSNRAMAVAAAGLFAETRG
jgi:poly(3-hydroxybutyrate) depolymerase